MRVSHRAIELDIRTLRPDLSHVTLRYDGSAMEEIEVPRDDSRARMAGAGPDVTRWIDAHQGDILDDPSERRRFSSIMPPAALYELVRNTGLGVAGNSGLVDGVLIARGCRPHICPDFVGAIAIELATGRPYALIYNREKGLKVYGATLTDLPEPLRKIVQEWDR